MPLHVARLYRAARGAGASRRAALDALLVSALALLRSATGVAERPGLRNACRHFAWQACLTARHGEDLASAVAEEQERGSTRAEDSAVDRHNNGVGRRYGELHAEALRAMPVRRAVTLLCDAALPMWRSGELQVVAPVRHRHR
ncbi:DUF6973 domain-containing protein [Nocardioides iriomotensis]|uniref:DUF6973 domain-containing protein n=1 Tax=Nocardioides iriomotensis TaxID=715784 RepID=A0A4Q5J1A7_9ACTN|nr:hypothetical protein [Nocardioides iriomotensis]RYU12272.1 hypothetical protein ETU37_09625 [Nocardioides iriomotensis]